MSDYFEKIRNQVMWDRLINVVEEQARTMMRVAFSTVVREAGDLSAGIFNAEGKLLAQAVTGTPGHVNSMARSVGHFLNAIPPETMREGDAYITNDPWKGTGHLFDLTVVTPTFHNGKLVALFACTAHVADIGGNGPDPTSRDVFAEGLFIPIMPLCLKGEMNKWLIDLMRANSREPDRLEGDVYALVASNEAGANRLVRMMEEYALDDLSTLSEHILSASDKAMRDAIAKLPKGTWKNTMTIDGFDKPLDLVATLTIEEDVIRIDFTGTSPVSRYGVNCPMCYTDAYTSFGVKCLVAPRLANNAAVLARIKVTAPEGCLINAPSPAPVTARAVIGQMLPDTVFGCFAQAMPDATPAEGTGASWTLRLGAGPGITPPTGGKFTAFTSQSFQSGGMGAHPKLDGLAATPFPSGVKSIAIEITEAMTPAVFWKKELRQDSGGAGARRGGLGQVMEIGSREDAPFAIFARFQRVDYPARGRNGGDDGAAGTVKLKSGKALGSRGTQTIPAGERLVVEMPGGGGLGAPATRDPGSVADDVRNGYVSRDAARAIYKVALKDDFSLDRDATARLRGETS
ncbi:MAG TPA: hydantoinase B/oxoprolinase family protein [Xanthobacteraceae bacterium]|jgi:N-methylhydantoinase B|nr:hydantoinase B/oxoprolinase family protein [Xanthobacteraceae bacterium]